MKTIKIFLASSEELTDDRNAFGNLVRKLDNIYEKRGIRIELFEWEDYDAAYNNCRKQDEYNAKIKASDMFLALFHTKAGKFTIEEFDVATEEFRKHASPKVYTYCKDLAEGEQELPELTEFKRKLFEEMGHYWSRYNNRDSMQLHFVMQLQMVETNNMEDTLKVEDGTVTIDGLPIAKMDNLQFAADNEGFTKMKEELAALPDRIDKARKRVEKYPDDEELKQDLQQLQNQYNSLKRQVEQESQLLLDFARNIAVLQGEQITNRMKRAIDAFYKGDVQEAKIILKEAEHDSQSALNDYQQSLDITEKKRQLVILSIGEILLKISATMADVSIPIDERIAMAIDLYKQCDDTAQVVNYPPDKYERFLHQYARFLLDYAHYREAIAVYERQIELSVRLYGVNDVRTAFVYNNIGMAYACIGEHLKAIDFACKSLQIKEDALSGDHPDLLPSYINIAFLYNNMGMPNAAIKHLEKALNTGANTLAKEQTMLASIYNNLAYAYYALANYDQALEYHHKALSIREKLLGDYPETAISYNSIGLILKLKNDYQSALTYYSKALNIQKKFLGPLHPDTAKSYNNLGTLYYNMGEYDNSIKYHLEGLKGQETSVGRMHIDTASSYWNLGHVYEEIGDTEKAIDSYTNALSYFEHKLGKENTYTIACYEKIADLLFQIKSYRQSGEYYSKAIGAYYTLGTKQEEDGNYEEALDSFNKLLALYERVSGPDHVNTASAHCAIARVYDHKKEHGKAIEHYETALSIQRSDEKGNMEDISSTCNNIAQVYYHIKDFESSLKYHTESLNLKKQLYDEGDIRIAHSYNNIGFVYIAIRNLEMAIACLSKALEIYEKTLGENHEQCIGLKDYISQMKSELEHNSHE